ncbi:cobalamin biosynthesis protein [Aeromonas diversa]
MITLETLAATPAAIMVGAALLEALLPWPSHLRLSALVPLLSRLGRKVCRPDGGMREQVRSGLLAMVIVWLPCAALLWSVRNLTLSEPLFDLLLLLLLLESRPLRELAAAIRRLAVPDTLPLARLQAAPWLKRGTDRLSPLGVSKAVTETLILRLVTQWAGPLFGYAIGGVQGALLWRVVALLAQGFSPKEPAFVHFGQPAARLHQALVTLPALLLSLPLLPGRLAAARAGLAWPFPAGGLLLSLLARQLRVRLGGPRFYAGDKVRFPVLGGGDEPGSDTPARALTRLQLIGWGWLTLALALTLGERLV